MIASINKIFGALLVLGSATAMWIYGAGSVYLFLATIIGVVLYVNGEVEGRVKK